MRAILVFRSGDAQPLRSGAKNKHEQAKEQAYDDADRAQLESAGNLCPVKESLHPAVNVIVEYVYPE